MMASRGETARFSIGPLSFAIEAEDLQAWVDRACHGDRIIYATGPTLPQKSAAVMLARTLSEERWVHLVQTRSARGWDFMAVRRPDPLPAPAKADVAAGAEVATGRVLRELQRCARAQLACPTNPELARACGLPNADAASYQLRKLTGSGAIMVAYQAPGERRIVTIVASGQTTVKGFL